MRVTVIPIIVRALGTVPKNIRKVNQMEIRRRIKTIHTTALQKSEES